MRREKKEDPKLDVRHRVYRSDRAQTFRPKEPNADHPFLALPGALMELALRKFALRPDADESPKPCHSIGIGERSFAATDGLKAVVLGDVAEIAYECTDRRAALLEAERAAIFGDGYDATNVVGPEVGADPDPANCPPEGDFPDVCSLLRAIGRETPVGTIGTQTLADVAALAKSAGASQIELTLSPPIPGERRFVKFRFDYVSPEPSFGDALHVPVVGIAVAGRVPEETS